MECMLCSHIMGQTKLDNIKKYHRSAHPKLTEMTASQREAARNRFDKMQDKGSKQLNCFMGPQRLIHQAPYKLAFVLAKHKMPFSHANYMVEFARAADPDSQVFQNMSSSRWTVTRKLEEIHNRIMRPEVQTLVADSALYWSYMIDESVDKGTQEQMGIFVRFINISKQAVEIKFLSYEKVEGSPNAKNLFQTLDKCLSREELPTDKLVAHTSDNAPVVISEMNGVAALAKKEYNEKLYVQHCVTHTEALMAKDGQKKVPNFVEKTIKEVLDYFRYSALRKHRFTDICEHLAEFNEAGGTYQNLVIYHRVRWLSLEQCVRRIVELLPVLAQYFDDTQHDMSVRLADRRLAAKLYEKVTDHEFHLYLHFLRDQLPDLADINKELQKRSQVLYTTYRTLVKFIRVFVSPVVHDGTLPLEQLMEHENLIDISSHDIQETPPFAGTHFKRQWEESVEHGQLSERELKSILSVCLTYIVTIGRSFLKRFPEVSFILETCQFMEPSRRKIRMDQEVMQVCDRFNNNYFIPADVLRSYRMYRLDESLDAIFNEHQDPVKFFCQLYQMEETRAFASLCILLLTIQPDICDLERGFSVMNYIKNQHRTQLTQEHLNAAVSVAMDSRSVSSFPFDKC